MATVFELAGMVAECFRNRRTEACRHVIGRTPNGERNISITSSWRTPALVRAQVTCGGRETVAR